jgi:hypothetical protein
MRGAKVLTIRRLQWLNAQKPFMAHRWLLRNGPVQAPPDWYAEHLLEQVLAKIESFHGFCRRMANR